MSSFWDMLTGNAAADASRGAAADTYGKQQAAGANAYGGFADLAKSYDPYRQTGLAGNTALQQLLQNPNSLSSLPGYQFDQQQGVQALDRSAAARGMLNSGRGSKDLLRFGTGLADQTYGNQFNRLMGATGLGMQATGAAAGLQGQGLQDQFQANYGSAGTIGQGDVAAAQAKQQGLQNLLSTGTNLLGMGMGSGMFGNPGFGGGRGSSYGGGGGGVQVSQGGGGGGYQQQRPGSYGFFG